MSFISHTGPGPVDRLRFTGGILEQEALADSPRSEEQPDPCLEASSSPLDQKSADGSIPGDLPLKPQEADVVWYDSFFSCPAESGVYSDALYSDGLSDLSPLELQESCKADGEELWEDCPSWDELLYMGVPLESLIPDSPGAEIGTAICTGGSAGTGAGADIGPA